MCSIKRSKNIVYPSWLTPLNSYLKSPSIIGYNTSRRFWFEVFANSTTLTCLIHPVGSTRISD